MDDNDMQGWAYQQELEHQEWLEEQQKKAINEQQQKFGS